MALKYDKTNYYDFNTSVENHKKICDTFSAAGFEIITGSNKCLLLDLDTPMQIQQYEEILQLAAYRFGVKENRRWISKSGKGLHVELLLEKSLNKYQRIALQAILGSDPKKELFSILRGLNGVREPTVLFKPSIDTKNGCTCNRDLGDIRGHYDDCPEA